MFIWTHGWDFSGPKSEVKDIVAPWCAINIVEHLGAKKQEELMKSQNKGAENVFLAD